MKGTKIPFLTLLSLLLSICCKSIQANGTNWQEMENTLPAYAITKYLNLLHSSRCRTEMEQFREAVDRRLLWSLRMLDASGKIPSGFISGNNYWLGSRVDCKFLSAKVEMPYHETIKKNNSLYRNPKEEYPPYELHFFGANMQHNSTLQYNLGPFPYEERIVLGLCLPASCTKNEVARMLHRVLHDKILPEARLFSIGFDLLNVNDFIDDYQWLLNWQIITMIFILTLFCGIIITGTILDVHQRCSSEKSELPIHKDNGGEISENKIEEHHENGTMQEEHISPKLKTENHFKKILLCFSIYTNMLQTLNLAGSSETIRIFHGLKFFGMVMIILAHTILFGFPYFSNAVHIYGYTQSEPVAQVLNNAPLVVDTFIFMGGFLTTYLFLKSYSTENKKNLRTKAMQFIKAIFLRYIRLTPTYLVVMMLMTIIHTWQDKIALFSMSGNDHIKCMNYWWRNLLYINNLFNFDELCLDWSWYLPNDFQFFIFGIFLLLLSVTHSKIAVGTGIVSLIGSILFSGYTAYKYDYRPTISSGFVTATDLYLPPWIRIAPYLIGMGTAKLLATWDYKLHPSKKILTVCWIFSIFCNCSIMFGTINKNMSWTTAVFYAALRRACWAVGIAWLVIACFTNNGGIVNKLLSLTIWIPLGRLTYCAYLLNPLLITVLYRFSIYPISLDIATTGVMFFGFVLITYLCAIVLTAATEVPIIRLLRIYLKSINSR